MNVRRAALPLLTALLVGGCVGLPKPSAPPAPRAPETRPPALAPADRHPPSALPAPPPDRPVEAEPREELGEVGEAREAGVREVLVPPRRGEDREGAGYGAGPAPLPRPRTPAPRPGESRPAGARPAEPRPAGARPVKKRPRPAESRAATRPPRPPAPAPARPSAERPAAGGQVPEMRRLCREAQRIDAPMGAADLCRSMYGR
ncbi:hypothetical protein [Streptomyces sp. NPDC085479]|uniref:hypothetical protein n=1 Tax=Streptomyces sp. NPDC085479 TaxID=3365726 RepID=UPI0037CD9F92